MEYLNLARMHWCWLSYLLFALQYHECVSFAQKVNNQATCEKQRKILTNTWGIVSDGSKQYPEDSYCEWIILANTTGQVITLKFIEMETECSYDHIYVYDGDSYSSNLLGSFSGNTIPKAVTATSGAMLILLYSDTNYAKEGFKAEYSITNCPLNCSGHGKCLGFKCLCEELWTGPACEVELCPDDCNHATTRGQCHNLLEPPRCICNRGYSGQSCSLPDYPTATSYNKWHVLAQEGTGLSPRAGHASAYIQTTDTLYVFGGFSFDTVLGDFLTFNFNTSQWSSLEVSSGKPLARWGHTMISYGNNLVLFGGELADGTLSNELWLYNGAKREWRKEAVSSNIKPKPVTKHTMTLVEDHWIYVFGGSLEDGSFSSLMYAINLNESAHWKKIVPRGGKEVIRRLVGHSTVYHAASKSLIVYGGLMVDFARFSKLSNFLHIFHIEKRYWSRIYYPANRSELPQNVVPLERAFHTSEIVGNYLVVYGGYTHLHSHEEICYDDRLYFYHLGCHKWVDGSKILVDFPGTRNPVSQGVLSHSMNVRRGHTLIVVGGYSGAMKGTLLSYVVPFGEQGGGCHLHKTRGSCISDLNCGWHPESNFCNERSFFGSMNLFGVMEKCSGLCSTLRDCHSCLVWGQPGGTNLVVESKNATQPLCGWCVQAIQCHSVGEPPPVCSNEELKTPIPWWGNKGTTLNQLEECQSLDKRPGMTFQKYRYPPNWDQPDEVSFINQTGSSLSFTYEFSRERERVVSGDNVARIRGFIHPMGAKVKNEERSTMKMESYSRAVLKISTDDREKNLEVVANHSANNYSVVEVKRTNRPLFKNDSLKQRYLTDFSMYLPTTDNSTAHMNIVWNGFKQRGEEKIPIRFLEPYRSGKNCNALATCLACISDIDCGWCQTNQRCVLRDGNGSSENLCYNNGDFHYLVTTPEECTGCGNYIDCESCVTTSPSCEWLVEDAHCTRRGRFSDAVIEAAKCPAPCHKRENCTSCLGDPGRCAWCEEKKECFLFATYTTAFMFGRCREWMDEDRIAPSNSSGRAAQCKHCSRHSDCKSCLLDLGCGWCSNKNNHVLGRCVKGDFSGPETGDCSAALDGPYNGTNASDILKWSYASCPDVNECKLGLHNCHPNATCINTRENFRCKCEQGFKGDGITKCIKTCSKMCKYGVCSEAPHFKCLCKLGWTGEACDINCGCNNHSTCQNKVGICDECHNYTHGNFCEKCRPGSFGSAIQTKGCQRCECNGHANEALGFCNNSTGECYCTDNTEGIHCEKCESGYYGNPRNGGRCYLECRSREIITNVTRGSLGSQQSSNNEGDHCLWILTTHSEFNEDVVKSDIFNLSNSSPIVLTIHQDINISCPHNHIYVYDGLPDFVAPGHLKKLLGAFCGTKVKEPIIVKANSSFLTIYYEAIDPNQGFNASYERVPFCQGCTSSECRKSCVKTSSCPNCSLNLGSCNEEYGICRCKHGFGGIYCSLPLLKSYIQWTVHYDPDLVISNATLPLPRMGHTLVAHNRRLWLFGGYSTVFGELNDTFFYDLDSQSWEEVIPKRKDDVEPLLGRHFHGSALVDGILYIYGGISGVGVLGDFWKYTLSHNQWSPIRPPLQYVLEVPELAGLTLTNVEKNLILIGGYSPKYGFLDKVLEYNIEANVWKEIKCQGSYPVGIYGHTSVFHNATSSIYIFGGFLYDVEKPIVSNVLFAFYLPTKRWSRLPPDVQPPSARYFHSSVIMDNYILIMGGRSNNMSSELLDDVFVYNINCNTWVGLQDVSNIGQRRMPPNSASAATIIGPKVYIFGGYDGQTLGQLISVHLPKDICRLYGNSRLGCVAHVGCNFCSVYENGDNKTSCYSKDGITPSGCYNPKESSEVQVTAGTSCNQDLFENRECYLYTTCLDCLSSFPVHSGFKKDPVCQWCSNCQVGRCVKFNTSCEKEVPCNVPQRALKNPSQCPLSLCVASDCEKCYSGKNTDCKWTRGAGRSNAGDWGLTVHSKASHWCCIWSTIHDFSKLVSISSAVECPKKCHEYKNCSSCKKSMGAEGGWHECYWSETLQECLSPSYEIIRCEGGNCGAILKDQHAECPVPCWQYDQAATCLMNPKCGWCAFGGKDVDGRGVCMGGGLLGPSGGYCNDFKVELNGLSSLPGNVYDWWYRSNQTTFWNYVSKPKENECLNGHHNCDSSNQECVDTLDGFKCQCKANYTLEGSSCKPVCQMGCDHGNCIAPDVCQCHFGHVGDSCSIKCKCNGHSNCEGPKNLTTKCLQCFNNTIGPQCEKCKTLFVGNPLLGGSCIPCKLHCNGHSDLCLGLDVLNFTFPSIPHDQITETQIRELVKEGSSREAICLNCKNHTEGERCDVCASGYFKAEEHIKDGCRLCECHGHGDTCNILNGENCVCHNNTENDRQCSQKNVKNAAVPCWKLQCSKCKEYFLGVPTEGHQCYRHMFLDKDYCFNPQGSANPQEPCLEPPYSILQSRSAFFAVQPRYMNVNIRITLDVAIGGVDLYLSAKEDTFVLDVNKTNGINTVHIDQKYTVESILRGNDEIPDWFRKGKRRKRESEPIMEEFLQVIAELSTNVTETFTGRIPLLLREIKATGLTTYVTLKNKHEFLLVKNLQNRLVITIPQDVHDLRTTRFFMVLHGMGNYAANISYGNLFFRQDQTRIDLFVFFSVFFSCFFLFLAICVVVWKVKQALDIRQARRLHVAEMKHMASRPFAHACAVIEDEPEEFEFLLYSPMNYRRKPKHSKGGTNYFSHHLRQYHSGRESPSKGHMHNLEDKIIVRPVAMEPTYDGGAAVCTTLIQLPGGMSAPVRLCLGSSLVTLRTNYHFSNSGIRAVMRRRASHVVL